MTTTNEFISRTAHLRLGLNCIFNEPRLRYKKITAKAFLGMALQDRMCKLERLWVHNVDKLIDVAHQLKAWDIRAYTMYHPLLPLYTHPLRGFDESKLDSWNDIMRKLAFVGDLCRQHDIRLFHHPDQFVLPASLNIKVAGQSAKELEYYAMLCNNMRTGMINIHLGGGYGNKKEALAHFVKIMALPGLWGDFSLSRERVEIQSAEVEKDIRLEAIPVSVAA